MEGIPMDQSLNPPMSGVAPGRPGTAKKAAARRNAVVALLLLAVIGAAGFLTWNGGSSGDNDQGLLFTIPAGASQSISQPGIISAVTIPTTIVFHKGDNASITIVNNDVVDERAGPFLVGAGQTYIQRFPKPGVYSVACTVNPAESLTITVE
jgi:hypothetical protein